MLRWGLNQFRDFILKISIGGSFFFFSVFWDMYTMILVSFSLSGCVDELNIMKYFFDF